MTQAKERTEARNVSMYPVDWAIVDAQDINSAGTSATLRTIVRQWNEWKDIMLIDAREQYDAKVPYSAAAH